MASPLKKDDHHPIRASKDVDQLSKRELTVAEEHIKRILHQTREVAMRGITLAGRKLSHEGEASHIDVNRYIHGHQEPTHLHAPAKIEELHTMPHQEEMGRSMVHAKEVEDHEKELILGRHLANIVILISMEEGDRLDVGRDGKLAIVDGGVATLLHWIRSIMGNAKQNVRTQVRETMEYLIARIDAGDEKVAMLLKDNAAKILKYIEKEDAELAAFISKRIPHEESR